MPRRIHASASSAVPHGFAQTLRANEHAVGQRRALRFAKPRRGHRHTDAADDAAGRTEHRRGNARDVQTPVLVYSDATLADGLEVLAKRPARWQRLAAERPAPIAGQHRLDVLLR